MSPEASQIPEASPSPHFIQQYTVHNYDSSIISFTPYDSMILSSIAIGAEPLPIPQANGDALSALVLDYHTSILHRVLTTMKTLTGVRTGTVSKDARSSLVTAEGRGYTAFCVLGHQYDHGSGLIIGTTL